MKARKDEAFVGEQTFKSQEIISFLPSVTKCSLKAKESQTLVCDFCSLLRSESYFPFFMLVAFEGGSILRAFFLLLSSPILFFLNINLQMKLMIFITFCGLRFKDVDHVSRAVLPKFYLENLNYLVYKILASAGSKKVFTSLPRVMVEGFLREYLKVDTVKGSELHTIGKYYTGFLSNSGLLVKHRAVREHFGEEIPDIGIGSSSLSTDQLFLSYCKEAFAVNKEDRNVCSTTIMPREKYPKPLIFHDARLAFLPTPLATLTMFIWLTLGIFLAIFRICVAIFLPPKLAIIMLKLSGVILEFNMYKSVIPSEKGLPGVLYVGNHKTLLDPLMLSLALGKPFSAVTFKLNRFAKFLSPIRTAALIRDRNHDAKIIKKLISEGDLVIFPEGTSCKEPYILRFSSLFAELTDEIVPFTVNTNVTMFHGTTTCGYKWLDSICMAMNPRPVYSLELLEKLPKELTMGGGRSSHEVANYVQKKIADALGFESTNLTRKDKLFIIKGNERIVQHERKETLNYKL
ncbi:hypothetical protein M9H77_19801 [Catharanthus roseus]|uniref:Uncharacterized protein n=1 Tax=Catharanthus roseus TaxID=4058 RepID=A0ACC0BBE0_CATRO|nr:hypothetical protein M9H77_19801 [Catharanthus roseus]